MRVAVQMTAVVEALRICTVPTGYPPPVGPATVAEKVSAVSDPFETVAVERVSVVVVPLDPLVTEKVAEVELEGVYV